MNSIKKYLQRERNFEFNPEKYQSMVFNLPSSKRTLQEEIDFSIKWFSVLYNGLDAEERVLTHMFFSLGGDHMWENGKIVSFTRQTDKDTYEQDKSEYNIPYYVNKREEDIIGLKEDIERYSKMEQHDFIVDRINSCKEKLPRLEAHHKHFNPFYLDYPYENERIDSLPYFYDSINITNIPDNVEDEYLLGAIRIVEYYIARIDTNTISASEKEVEKIIEIQKNIVDRFGDRLESLGYDTFDFSSNDSELKYALKFTENDPEWIESEKIEKEMISKSKREYINSLKKDSKKYISIKGDWSINSVDNKESFPMEIGKIVFSGDEQVFTEENYICPNDFKEAINKGWLVKTL